MVYIITTFLRKLLSAILFFTLVTSLKTNNPYLSVTQWQSIKTLIINKNTTAEMRNTLRSVIYKYYEGYAISSANKFKKFHNYKCRNINSFELSLYAKFGLYRAIKKYNGSSSFIHYADKYINGELYKGLTDLYPLSSVTKSERRLGKYNKNGSSFENDRYSLLHRYNTQFISYDNYWIFDKQHSIEGDNCNLQKIIYCHDKNRLFEFINTNMDTFTKKVFYYKYDSEFNVIRSNHHIAELMVCSEEHIRKTLLDVRNIILNFQRITSDL